MKRSIITTAAFVGVAILAVPTVDAAKPEPKNLTIGASATTIKFGGTVTLSGKLNGANNSGRQVTIEQDTFPIDAFTNAG